MGPLVLCSLILSLALSACRSDDPENLHYLGAAHQADYLQQATKVSYTDLENPVPRESYSLPPRTIRNRDQDEVWDLSLGECIHVTLANSEIVRSAAQYLNPSNPLLTNPDFVPSTFDPAIQESGILYGRRGVEAALSDFDAQLTMQMLWGRNETVQNNRLSLGLPPGDVLLDETATNVVTLQKRLANGGQVQIGQTLNYAGQNIDTLLFPSIYQGSVQFQYRQPLLAGSGTDFTRIAGPVSTSIQGITGVQQGVLIARINGDIAIADFERNVQQLVHDAETLYWQLHFAYQAFAVRVEARDAALEAWQQVDTQKQAGTGTGGALEAEVRDLYLQMKEQAVVARNTIYDTEAQLRRLMALPVNDGRVIRPSETPVSAEYIPDWTVAMEDALSHRPEIRRQKWNVRSLELQLRAAKNLARPRLDFVSGYQVNGFGDDLFDQGNGDATGRYESYYRDLLQGQKTGWNLGFEFSVPIGRRYALAQVQSVELQLAKGQAMLAEQEKEISHEVASVFRAIDSNYFAAQNAYNRLQATRERGALLRTQYRIDPEQVTLDQVLRAKLTTAQTELELGSALLSYNTALADLAYRTGQSLEMNNIHLVEGAWDQAAYDDATRHFEERRHAMPNTDLQPTTILE